MTSSFWLAAAAYLLPSFPLGYFWHLTIFRAQYERMEVYRPTMLIPLGLASMITQALLFAWVYPKLFSTAHDAWLMSAMGFAGFFGLLALAMAVLPAAAKYRMNAVKPFFVLETAFTALQFLVVSPLIALAWRAPA